MEQRVQTSAAPGPATDEMEQARYNCVLRSIFGEIFEVDFSGDSYRLIHMGDVRFCPPPPGMGLAATLRAIAETLIHPEDREIFLRVLNPKALHQGENLKQGYASGDVRKKCLDGQYRWARFTVFPLVCAASGRPLHMICVQDVDEQKRAVGLARENALLQRRRLDELRYKTVLDHTNTLVFEWRGNQPTYTSPHIPQLLAGNYNGRWLFDVWREDNVLSPEDGGIFKDCLNALEQGASSGEMTVRLRRRDGRFIWCRVTYTCLADPDLGIRYIGTISDVDEVTRATQALRFRAEYDPLTGAYNMQTFFEKADLLIRQGDGPRHIVRFDVAGFKGINEMFGLEEGDRLLRAIAHLVREQIDKRRETFARLSGDVFVACLAGDRDRVRRFVGWLSRQLREYTQSYRVMLFFGICPVEKRRTPVHVLCDWAHLALKTVKGSDLTNYAFYDGELRARLLDENNIKDQMHEALEKGQFVLYLQPKVEISSGRIVGAEALARWRHPTDGLILPGRFVPLFERNGFIVRFDEYIWEQTCKMLRLWLDKGYRPTPVSINVSRMHFNDDHFSGKLLALTDKYHLPRHLLELELTESAFFESEKTLIRVMNDLQKQGFVFSMDDFGTGYSSLSTLRALPFNIVKLDRTFISDGTDNERGQIVARNTVTMARQLKMKIIAEGVETVEQARFLLSIGCNYAQGYYYARPVDPEEFEVLSFVQEKAFWVDPSLREEARRLNLPLGLNAPDREY